MLKKQNCILNIEYIEFDQYKDIDILNMKGSIQMAQVVITEIISLLKKNKAQLV